MKKILTHFQYWSQIGVICDKRNSRNQHAFLCNTRFSVTFAHFGTISWEIDVWSVRAKTGGISMRKKAHREAALQAQPNPAARWHGAQCSDGSCGRAVINKAGAEWRKLVPRKMSALLSICLQFRYSLEYPIATNNADLFCSSRKTLSVSNRIANITPPYAEGHSCWSALQTARHRRSLTV